MADSKEEPGFAAVRTAIIAGLLPYRHLCHARSEFCAGKGHDVGEDHRIREPEPAATGFAGS